MFLGEILTLKPYCKVVTNNGIRKYPRSKLLLLEQDAQVHR